jgi:hypothetical protein
MAGLPPGPGRPYATENECEEATGRQCFLAVNDAWYPLLYPAAELEPIAGAGGDIRKHKSVITVGNAWHNLHKTVVVSLPQTGRMLQKMSKNWSWK